MEMRRPSHSLSAHRVSSLSPHTPCHHKLLSQPQPSPHTLGVKKTVTKWALRYQAFVRAATTFSRLINLACGLWLVIGAPFSVIGSAIVLRADETVTPPSPPPTPPYPPATHPPTHPCQRKGEGEGERKAACSCDLLLPFVDNPSRMLGARLSHTERACCNRQVLCLDLLCLYLDRCSASTWASSARCSRASSSRCLACARSETQKHTHKIPNTPFSHMWRPHFSHMSEVQLLFSSRKMLERSFFFLYTRGGRTAFLVLVMAIAWSCKHVSFITKVFSLTRPISPICQRPFFPYLTFEFFVFRDSSASTHCSPSTCTTRLCIRSSSMRTTTR